MSAEGAWRPGGSFGDRAFAVTAAAYERASERWELAIQDAIAALFDFLADEPARTANCVLRDVEAGPAALERRDRTLERFTALLQPGFAAADNPPPAIVAEAITGGIYELVRVRVLERRLEDLRAAVPDATVVALSPFVGVDRAIEIANSKNVQTNR